MAKFPDLTGDGEVTQADVLKGRGVYKKGGSVMKHDHGHKPTAKMSHGGHYCWGGKAMKKAEGGMAKGGNWIQGAIKKPGALKKSLGVPAGKTIPAGKLEKASHAPGKMGQRARLAMTLKGMK